MRCFMWQENMVLMSMSIQAAMRIVKASSGDELDVKSAKLAGTDRISSSSSSSSSEELYIPWLKRILWQSSNAGSQQVPSQWQVAQISLLLQF